VARRLRGAHVVKLPEHRMDFSCCPDLEELGSLFSQIGHENAVITVGPARIDTREGVEMERASVYTAITDAQGESSWSEFSGSLRGPLSDDTAKRLWEHFSSWYRLVLKDM